MIDLLSLGAGIVIGAIVGVGGSIWFVKRKLEQMQNNMFGPMGEMMQDPATQQDQPDMEAVMGDMMDMMEDSDGDTVDADVLDAETLEQDGFEPGDLEADDLESDDSVDRES